MARHYKSLGNAFYDSMDSRRKQERMDGEMISEDHSAMANLPQSPIMKFYARPDGFMTEGLNDSISGVDAQINLDARQRDKHLNPKKV